MTFHAEHSTTPTRQFSPAERERLEARMWNWSRFMLDDKKNAGKGVCGSAEKWYTPPREDEERFERSAREPIDIVDAGKVEDAVLLLRTQGQRQYLISWYCYRARPEVMTRRFRLPEIMLVPYLWAILGAVQWRLDRPLSVAKRKRVGYKALDNSTPAHAA